MIRYEDQLSITTALGETKLIVCDSPDHAAKSLKEITDLKNRPL